MVAKSVAFSTLRTFGCFHSEFCCPFLTNLVLQFSVSLLTFLNPNESLVVNFIAMIDVRPSLAKTTMTSFVTGLP